MDIGARSHRLAIFKWKRRILHSQNEFLESTGPPGKALC